MFKLFPSSCFSVPYPHAIQHSNGPTYVICIGKIFRLASTAVEEVIQLNQRLGWFPWRWFSLMLEIEVFTPRDNTGHVHHILSNPRWLESLLICFWRGIVALNSFFPSGNFPSKIAVPVVFSLAEIFFFNAHSTYSQLDGYRAAESIPLPYQKVSGIAIHSSEGYEKVWVRGSYRLGNR